MTEPLLSVWVPGKPKTKGSLDVVNARRGKAVVRENVVGSKRWRELVRYSIAGLVAEPVEGPVVVDLLFVLPTDDAAKARSGDIDKLARNILDALQDAGVYRDDAQVIRLVAHKIADGDQRGEEASGTGVRIWVWRGRD